MALWLLLLPLVARLPWVHAGLLQWTHWLLGHLPATWWLSRLVGFWLPSLAWCALVIPSVVLTLPYWLGGVLQGSPWRPFTLVLNDTGRVLCRVPGQALSGADLHGVDLTRARLAGRDLRQCNLSQAVLREADLAGCELAGADLAGANLTGVDLSGRDLRGCDLTDAVLQDVGLADCDLSGVDLSGRDLRDLSMSNAALRDADLRGCVLTGVDLSDRDLRGARLAGAALQNANLTGCRLLGADLSGADLRGARLAGALLRNANLTDCDLTSVDLTGQDLRGWDLSGAVLRDANLTGCDLTGADLSRRDLRGVKLSGAAVRDVDLSHCDLTGVVLSGLDLRGAHLAGAVLRDADLSGCQLAGADLAEVHLTDAQLIAARLAVPLPGRLPAYLSGLTPPPGMSWGSFRHCPVDDMPQVLIPAGEFLIGSSATPCQVDELPQTPVLVSAFWIDLHPVTVGQYRRFCQATRWAVDDEWLTLNTSEQHPVVDVFWDDACAYAEWAGRELPTEAQWEKAARGGTTTVYPWGDAWDPQMANGRDGGPGCTTPVASYPPNGYGLYDVIGNVREWCRDWYGETWYGRMPRLDPCHQTSGLGHVTRGGSYYHARYELRVSTRHCDHPRVRYNFLGFRCSALA